MAGERSPSRPCQFYSYDPQTGGSKDLGLLIVDRSPYYYWRGQQFDAMITGKDGTILVKVNVCLTCFYIFHDEFNGPNGEKLIAN